VPLIELVVALFDREIIRILIVSVKLHDSSLRLSFEILGLLKQAAYQLEAG
jgi:hypothetical protein